MEITSNKRKGGINQGLIILSGLIFVIGALLTYYFILRGVFGKFNTDNLIPSPKIVKSAFAKGKPHIAILYSQYTENMLPEGSTWLNDNITTWKKFLDNSNNLYDIISDETIELGQHYKYGLIVLPGSKSLSEREVVNLKKYIDRGGSVFATSGTASYSDDGKWRGWQFFNKVFGINFVKAIKNDDFTKIHTIRGGLPITANIPTGFPLKVATWDKPIAAEVMDPRTVQVSFWYNYRLENGLARENILHTAGIVYGNYGKGRFVWMGFEINSVIGVQEDYIFFDRLFNNSINWLTYKPLAYYNEWPRGYKAAAIITPILSHDIYNINNLLSVLKSERVRATFFVDPYRAEQNKKLVKTLARYGDVGALVDIGYLASINDTSNSLDDYNTQLEKLNSAKLILESVTGKSVTGAIPYYGLFDENTIQALIDAKYKFVITDSLTDRSVPKTIIRGDERLISITKTARDDYEVIRDFGLTLPNYQLYTYQEDIDRILFEGGLYVFKMHTEYQCKPENIGVVRKVIKELKRKNFWITTASELSRWFERKDNVEVRVEPRGENRTVVTVSNPGDQTVNSLVVKVDLNQPARRVSLSSEIIGTKLAKYEYDKVNNIVYLYINDLEKGESRTYYLDYTLPNS
ncbi:MAG: polysaccharide deacetylase family protein [Bacteroidetes bacterium]|nr:polysaccharide deacetylase family protein [Bacteroidota bacterium]